MNNDNAMQPVRVDVVATPEGGFDVRPIWEGVDRPYVGGWGIGRDRKLAERLATAIRKGLVYRDAKVATDVNGKTYVTSSVTVRGRALNADLARLGC